MNHKQRWTIGSALAGLVFLTACQPGSQAAAPPAPSSTSSEPTVTTTPASDVIGPSAMLQPADIGPAWRVDEEVIRGDWQLEWLCHDTSSGAGVTTVSYGSRSLTDRPVAVAAAENQPYHAIATAVTKVGPGQGPTSFSIRRNRLAQCQPADVGSPAMLSIVDSNFAGDESVLVKVTGSSGRAQYSVYVRRHDVIIQIEWLTDATTARTLAARAPTAPVW
jgi:hypothetical protein